ncbi:hypothetical protein C8R46DRAFT_863142, partial [Mycena filopes]
MRKMVNSLSSKMEIGSPMASMYVLGNPDHYTSHKYTPFPWRSYVSETGRFIASSGVDDYRYRPAVFERVTLYEWIQCGDKKARTVKQKERFLELLYASHDLAASFEDESDVDKDTSSVRISDLSDDDLSSDWLTDDEDGIVVAKQRRADKDKRPRSYPFLSDHPRYRTHAATCDFTHINSVIPNFIGGALPRSDKGDRGYYGMTMLTLFKPWRSPGDLKDSVSTWEQAFGEHEFTKRQRQLLQNFNVRYECNDERDDHFAQLKRQLAQAEVGFTSHYPRRFMGERDKLMEEVDAAYYGMDEDEEVDDENSYVGPRSQHLLEESREIQKILRSSGWLN